MRRPTAAALRRRTRHEVVAPAATERDEVASALLVRLTQQELTRRGVLGKTGTRARGASDGGAGDGASARGVGRDTASGQPFGPTIGEATVALAPKRTLLAGVAERHGLVPLLEVGRGIDRLRAELPDDPVLAALLQATGPDDAIVRWQRLERFVHSRHRLECLDSASGPRGAGAGGDGRLIRHAGPPGAPPSPAEDALVLGVMAELCRQAGAVDIAVSLVGPDGREHPVLADSRFNDLPADWSAEPGATGLWRFAWAASTRGRPAARGPAIVGTGHPTDGARGARPLAALLTAVIAADLCRTWTLAGAARALAAAGPSLAPRTLQRRLAAAGATFPGVVRAARVAAAGRLLAEGRLALGVIGFACGFTDQPHFTRQFKRQLGMTPAEYRRAFARAR